MNTGRPPPFSGHGADSGRLSLQVHGKPEATALIYLPGLHGDWTLLGEFRNAVHQRVRLVEFEYPRTSIWTLADHARAVQAALNSAGIVEGYLLAESFGSLVAWALLELPNTPTNFRIRGIILAGGFVRYPIPRLARLARVLGLRLPDGLLRRLLSGYARVAGLLHRRSPEARAGIQEFVRRRLEPGDRDAVMHRLQLLAAADPRPVAATCTIPVWSLTGFGDPVVPWPLVSPWLRRRVPGWVGHRIIWASDHTVLATRPAAAARIVLEWIRTDDPQSDPDPDHGVATAPGENGPHCAS
ncbi:MAG: alpha/beta hydrolase [Verrucomicrobiae bacterium]|nr:alpha/beta hydrolase [Verrucomicrobiae bacterium]